MYSIDDYQTIVQRFEAVLAALDKLCEHIKTQLTAYPVWVDSGQGGFVSDRAKAIQALQYLKLPPGLVPQETYSCPGAIGATVQTLDLVDNVNVAKNAFKAAVHAFLAKQPASPYPTRKVRHILSLSGYPGIMLKQVYRHLSYIDYHPRRVAWTQSKSGSYQVINAMKAKELLLKAGQGKHIDIQLSKLNQLKKTEKLVIYHAIRPLWEINIASFKDKKGRSAMQKIRQSLPLAYLHDDKLATPMVCFSAKAKREKGAFRKDKQLETVPFLQSISAYAYKV